MPTDDGTAEPVAAGQDESPSDSLSAVPFCKRWIPVSVWQMPPSPPALLNRNGVIRYEFEPCALLEGHDGGCRTAWWILWETNLIGLYRKRERFKS